jgi:hypothetical protein
MNQQQNQKKKMPVYGNDNVLESLRGVGSSVGKTIVKDVIAQSGNDMLRSILGGTPQSGELKQNQAIEFEKAPEAAPAIQPRRMEAYRVVARSDEMEAKQKIESVRAELKALSQSIKSLRQEITKTVMEVPVDPGIYHLNFFDHLRSYLVAMKQEVDDSRTWLMAFNTKKAKMGYWGMFKKHGTSFGMSNERAIATSAG